MEKRLMSTTTKRKQSAAPATFDALVCELMPTAIHDKTAYGNAMEMVRRLAVVPNLNEDQKSLNVAAPSVQKCTASNRASKPYKMPRLRFSLGNI